MRLNRRWLRLLGPLLLVGLLVRVNVSEITGTLADANPALLAAAIVLNLPHLTLKTLRWQRLMQAQDIHYNRRSALLAYFGSLFIGLLTPGRLGEFIKAVHVSRDCNVSLAAAFSSVLADRLFDLYALLVVGSAALLTLALGGAEVFALAGLVLVLTVPLGLFLHKGSFTWFRRVGLRFGALGERLFGEGGILPEVRDGLRRMTWPWVLAAVLLTGLAYSVFYSQCYLLARSLDLSTGFGPVMFAVALGSLVTLVPVSISGLGTREAAIIAYLDTAGVGAEAALSFSLLVFVTFYIAGGLMGAIAWWIKPAPLDRTARQDQTI